MYPQRDKRTTLPAFRPSPLKSIQNGYYPRSSPPNNTVLWYDARAKSTRGCSRAGHVPWRTRVVHGPGSTLMELVVALESSPRAVHLPAHEIEHCLVHGPGSTLMVVHSGPRHCTTSRTSKWYHDKATHQGPWRVSTLDTSALHTIGLAPRRRLPLVGPALQRTRARGRSSTW